MNAEYETLVIALRTLTDDERLAIFPLLIQAVEAELARRKIKIPSPI